MGRVDLALALLAQQLREPRTQRLASACEASRRDDRVERSQVTLCQTYWYLNRVPESSYKKNTGGGAPRAQLARLPAVIDAALERARAALAGAGGFESTELVRAERDARDERDRHRQ